MLKGAIEDNVLTLLCYSKEHASALTLQLSPDIFSTVCYRKIAQKSIDYIVAYNEPPGIHLRDLLERDLLRGDDGIVMGRVLEDMDKLHPDLNPDYVLQELGRFIALRKLMQSIEDAADAAHNGDLEGAERALYQRDIAQASSPGIWLHDSHAMLSFLDKNDDEYFPSGIETLDQRNIRPARKTMFLMIGAKKSGKSWFLIEVGKQAILHRKSVLHITLEMGEEQVAQRYTQALFALTSNEAATIRVPIFKKDSLGRITSLDFDTRATQGINLGTRVEIAKRLDAFRKRTRLLIKEFPTSTLTVAHLNSFLDSLSRQDNFRPDLLLIDYPDLMAMHSDRIRTDTSQIFKQLRGLAVARNMALVTVTQANRGGDAARTVGSAHVGEDFTKVQTADIVCTISKSSAEREIGLARILVDAARNAEDKWVALITQSYASGQFCIDSSYMNKFLDEEISRMTGQQEDNE